MVYSKNVGLFVTLFILVVLENILFFLMREEHTWALGSFSLPSGLAGIGWEDRFGGFKNEITICQDELEGQNCRETEDWESTTERKKDSDASSAARNLRRHYSALAGHSAGSGHALATAAFFSGQIGQSMHLSVPIPICHCPPVPGAVPLSA